MINCENCEQTFSSHQYVHTKCEQIFSSHQYVNTVWTDLHFTQICERCVWTYLQFTPICEHCVWTYLQFTPICEHCVNISSVHTNMWRWIMLHRDGGVWFIFRLFSATQSNNQLIINTFRISSSMFFILEFFGNQPIFTLTDVLHSP